MSNKVAEKNLSQNENTAVDPPFALWALLHQTVDAITRSREKELKQYGIAIRQVAALFIISSLGGSTTPTELAHWLFRKTHTISSILNRMEKEGLISKSQDPDRKNVVRVILTDKGKAAYTHSARRKTIHQIMSCLNEAEMAQLESYLNRLREAAFKGLKITKRPLFPPSK